MYGFPSDVQSHLKAASCLQVIKLSKVFTGCFKMNSGALAPRSIYYIKSAATDDASNERETQKFCLLARGAHVRGIFHPQSTINS